ncbi:MAG: tRNA A-37 threonylcarbamoyl transferase component Bud32 [Gammaproteobacteria bacterium]
MPNFDLHQILTNLGDSARALLEGASRFCKSNGFHEVTLDDFLLQMLDNPQSITNQKLQEANIEPRDWIKTLIIKSQSRVTNNSANPVFSTHLISFLHTVNSNGINDELGMLNLLTLDSTLLNHHDLPGVETLKYAKVTETTNDIVDIDFSGDGDDESYTHDDDTLIVSADEIANFSGSVIGNSMPEILGYEIIESIGQGGMAQVFRAIHTGLEREVALKVLTPSPTQDDDFYSRFLREARIVAKLAHRNIIQIYDVQQSDQLTYLAMELVTGGELSDHLNGAFEPAKISPVLSQILEALTTAHESDFIHRDIKPANILLRADGSVVLTDFGIARAMSEDTGLTLAGAVVGTPKYMSPEQARGDKLDHRSDLYSVGVLFYQMIEGKLPYSGESAMGTAMKHILDPIPQLSDPNSRYQAFLDRAMAKSADDRFQLAGEMIESLNRLPFD